MSTTIAVTAQGPGTLGLPVPPHTAHAISVSLPTWRDNVGYEEGEERVVQAQVAGYPRFFIHLSIRKLANICEQKFGASGERCLLLPSHKIAEQCREFMLNRAAYENKSITVRLVQYLICPEDSVSRYAERNLPSKRSSVQSVELHIVLFPLEAFPIAKQFWQHTGLGISSRLAEFCLSLLSDEAEPPQSPPSPVASRPPRKTFNKHYSASSPKSASFGNGARRSPPYAPPAQSHDVEVLSRDQIIYVEERYGRNLSLAAGAAAKRALRRRIAGVLVRDNIEEGPEGPLAGRQDFEVGPSSRGVHNVTENDVYLFSCGMAAIFNAHQLALAVRPAAKSVCFGFPYTDTLKILEKWGPGCHFLGHGFDSDIETLESILSSSLSSDLNKPPILALFTEFPSNPLLRSANLTRLRALADKYDFLIVVDETIGNFVNVDVLPYTDITVSSLSKVFSGDGNVMGGSLVLNPAGRHYHALSSYMAINHEDTYFAEDAIFMERNSRDFVRRIRAIDRNAEMVCDFLRECSLAAVDNATNHGPHPSQVTKLVIKEVFYPKWETRENYQRHRILSPSPTGQGGFGGLFSLTFTSALASRTFFDALGCHKGPSLGTCFTLACPYTVLAHYGEFDWAAKWGVEEGLVRVSVGMEEESLVRGWFERAVEAAAEAEAEAEAEADASS